MGREEQQEEREVLDSIFPDEITDITETEFRVSVVLDVTNAHDDDSEPPTLLLGVTYTPNYPDEAPRLDVTAPPNAPKHELLDVQEDKGQLLEALEPTIEENLGMQMVFTLVSVLKDTAEELIASRQRAADEADEAVRRKAEEEENRKFQGTAVTKESFLEWRAKFRKEMEEAERRKAEEKEAEEKKNKKSAAKEEKKLTGRELWEKGLAKGDEEEEGEDALDEVSRLKVSA